MHRAFLFLSVRCSAADFLAQFHQHAMRIFRMHKTNEFIVCSSFRFGVQQCKSFGLQAAHGGVYIIHCKRNVVNAFAAFFNKLCNGTVGFGGFEQFDFAFTGLEKRGVYAFAFHLFCFVTGGAQQAGVQVAGSGQVFYGNADVFNFFHAPQKYAQKKSPHAGREGIVQIIAFPIFS